jgi:3-oxoadipate enol-lactonase
VTVPFVETKSLRMHYQWDGPAGAPTLVLSNSLGTNLALWEPQAPAFAKTFRVLRYDSRGHGQTSATSGEYSVELLARDVLDLLDALELQHVHFCGLSVGGMTGMWLVANAPQRLDKLVLCNTSPKIGTAESWNARIQAVREGGTKSVAQIVVERWFTSDFRAKNSAIVEKTKSMIESTSREGYLGTCAAVRDFDFWASLKIISTPALVIAGTHDVAATPADAQKLAREIKGAHYVELAAAHISNIEDAGRFTEAVSAFLNNS